MFKLKNREELIYSALHVCHIEGCKLEAEKIYASSESSIIDVCNKHYDLLIKEQYKS
jgi:hypothetical protein